MRDLRTSLVGGGAMALAVLLPGVAEACAVCGPGTEESRVAFIVTTAILSAMPLILLGGAGYWLRRRFHEMERETQEARAEALRASGQAGGNA